MESYYIMNMEFQFGKVKILEMDGGVVTEQSECA